MGRPMGDVRDVPELPGLQEERPAPREAPTSEFVCPGCGRPLHVTLHSDFCLAEAQVFCPECERDYRERRGRWAPAAEGWAAPRGATD